MPTSVSLGLGVNNRWGAVVTNSSGVIYVVGMYGTYNIGVKKSTDGGASFTSPSSGSLITSTTIFGENCTVESSDMAMGADGYIHFIVGTRTNIASQRLYSYATLNTADDSWSSWEQVDYSNRFPTSESLCSIAVDSNGKPHAVYLLATKSGGSTFYGIYYKNRISGSWSARETVSGTLGTQNSLYPSIAIRDGDNIEANYVGQSTTICYRSRTSGSSGSWGTEQSASVSAYTGKRTIVITSGSTPYRYAGYSSGTYENNSLVSSSYDVHFEAITASTYQNTRYVLYADYSDDDVKYISNSGSGWSGPTTLHTSTQAGGVTTEYAYNFEYQSSRINYLYVDSSTSYFCYLNFGVSYQITPNAVTGSAATVSPTVVQSSMSVSPAVGVATVSGVDPTIILEGGGQTAYPNPASSSAVAMLGACYNGITFTPGAVSAVAVARIANARLKIGWGKFFKDPGDNVFILSPVSAKPSTLVGSVLISGSATVDLTGKEASARALAVDPTLAGVYALWRWDGSQWVGETVLVYQDGWQTKPLSVWLENEWKTVG